MSSILETPAGTWRAQVEHQGRREYRTFSLKTIAEKWAREREVELERGEYSSTHTARKTPFSQVIAAYRRAELPKKRNRAYKYILDTLEREFGDTRLTALGKDQVTVFRDERLEIRAEATVVKELNLLRSLIDFAISEMSIRLPTNVARLVKNPKVDNQRTRIFFPDEEEYLLRHMNDDLKELSIVANESAMRLGELLQLETMDLDLQRRIAHVIHDPARGRFTKTDKSRVVPLTSRAVKTIKTRQHRTGRTVRVFDTWLAGDSFQHAYKQAITKARRSYVAECELRKEAPSDVFLVDLHFHDFRHVAISKLAKHFPNILDLAKATGHENLKTLQRYYHPDPAELASHLP